MSLKRAIDMYKEEGFGNGNVRIIQPVSCGKAVEKEDSEVENGKV